VIAHIGNIPVEEWLPFLVPLVGMYVYGRRWGKRRREAVRRLPGPIAAIDGRTLELVRARWDAAGHGEVASEQLPMLYPPGPDGVTISELAKRTGCDVATVRSRLEDLIDLGYVELEPRDGDDESQAWLTVAGFDLARVTEDALLTSVGDDGRAPRREGSRSGRMDA
jgi:hypothetical protein